MVDRESDKEQKKKKKEHLPEEEEIRKDLKHSDHLKGRKKTTGGEGGKWRKIRKEKDQKGEKGKRGAVFRFEMFSVKVWGTEQPS